MLDTEDLKWIAATATELNTMLQQVSRYSDLSRQHKLDATYLDHLDERVDVASRTAQAIFDRVTSAILAGNTAKVEKRDQPQFSVLPAPEKALTAPPAPKSVTKAVARPAGPPPAAKSGLPENFNVLNANGTRELILLVDDEAEISELAAEMLATEGYRIILAKDGIEALQIYRAIGAQIGLVILDFFLPVLDGDAVFEELHLLNPDVNVVLSSGFAEQTKLAGMLARGLRGFIPKPYTRQKLLAQVSMTLDASRQAIA